MKVFATLSLVVCALVAASMSPRRAADDQARPAAAASTREQAYRANNLGVALLERFEHEPAVTAFRNALRLAPDLHVARLNLAIALFYAGHAPEAETEATAAAGRLPDVPAAHYVLGLAAKANDHSDAAIAAFERVLQLDPADAATKVQLGQIHLQQRRLDQAIKLFQEALAAEPYNVTAAYNAAIALTRAGRTDDGRAAMQRFEALRDSVYGVTYSQSYLGQGRYAEAIASTGAEPQLVNPAPPPVGFADATATWLSGVEGGGTAASEGGVTLFDADGDGDLDLLEVGNARTRYYQNDGKRLTDASARAGLSGIRDETSTGAIAGDYDNDGKPDLLLLREDGVRLMHRKADGTYEDATSTAFQSAPKPGKTAAFADVDHDGDLDIVTAGAAVQLLRNNGNGTFTDNTDAAGIGVPGGHAGLSTIATTDFDNGRDIDLVLAGAGATPILFRNMRDGTFRDVAATVGLPARGPYAAMSIADVNKDGYPDVFVAPREGAGVIALSDGQGRFRTRPAPDDTRGTTAAQFVDYDNDGLIDLLVAGTGGLRAFRNVGGDAWNDVTAAARLQPSAAGGGTIPPQSIAIGDLDNDGDPDLVVRSATGQLRVLRNDGGNRHASVAVRLTPRVSNRSGIGAKIELRAGSLRQVLETSSATPAVAPADARFGLGERTAPDVVRVLWPSGILQAETSFPAAAATKARTVTISELDRKPSSCPYLFTWNGTRFEFITDFMGGGEMGDWIGPAQWNHPDPDEYVRIRGDRLQARNGRYELRVTNELEEALFVDRMQLVAVDHPAGTDVFPNEGLKQPPLPPFHLTSTRDARPPVRAVDEHGHDVLSKIASFDRRYPDDFGLLPIRGYAAPHALVLDIGRHAASPVLLLTGWTDYAFSNDNVAASHSNTTMSPPSLQVRNASGAWQTVIDEIGFPVGRPQTIAVNLAGKFLSASREVRILTNMRIYWDQILVGTAVSTASFPRTRLDPIGAGLRWRGFSAETTPDGREPYSYDYDKVSTTAPWKAMIGRYTREGDVRPLLRAADDLFVVSRPGDEIALTFDATAAPALPKGWTRTFLLYAYGYSKEMNPRSATPDTVGPLPFRGMSRYPYDEGEHYPRTEAHRRYLDHYNTRVVRRPTLSIDAAAAGGGSR